ncbi:hypothetical protein GGI21_000989 [Coemansia aciculifera]|nr:hypothetical protein GGI21_000989 [Coemansia aciculifera]
MVDRAGVSAIIKKRYGVVLRAAWLEQCARHIEQELSRNQEMANNATLVHLETQVRLVAEQLVNSEIGDSCHPSLAVNAGSKHVTGLPGHPGAFLQVQSVVEVGISKYAMWEAAREKEDFEQRGIRPSYLPQLPNDDELGGGETSSSTAETQQQTQTQEQTLTSGGDKQLPKIPHKMLKLVLTDGQSQVAALEVEPIAQLSAELTIGSKVIVKSAQIVEGTGVMCLRAGDIRIVGGAPAQYAQQTLRARMAELLGMEDRRRT